MKIRRCETKDIQSLCAIYNYYVENTLITFEEELVSVAEMTRRTAYQSNCLPWYVCERDGAIVGYAYATKWKERSAYRYSFEITVYIKNSMRGQGAGKALYAALLESLDKINCHIILGCIALPNQASIGLHEYFGFKKVAHFSEVGYKFNQWVDVGYWQRTGVGISCVE